MTVSRRRFIQSAVAAAVSAALPTSARGNHNDINQLKWTTHEWSGESEMCLRCRMTRLMVEETGRDLCPRTALYEYRTYGVSTLPKEVNDRYAAALAYSMRQTREVMMAQTMERIFPC